MSWLQEPLAQALTRADAGWRPVIDEWAASDAGRNLLAHVEARRDAGAVIYPARVLHALELTPLPQVRVVILGQDPYHGAGQAEGLAFSVPAGQRLPPSLRNIFKELQRDTGFPVPKTGHLGAWARQGVLLLNTSLTVEDGRPGSHAKQGWEALTDAVVKAVANDPRPKVFMLWGAHAQVKKPLLLQSSGRHLILESNHPSPLSATRGPAPFLGCGHFSAANRFIAEQALGLPIDWAV